MHNGFVRVDNEKMSKSLGNFFTVRQVLAKYDAEVVRFFIVRAHYRSPLNYSDQHLEDAKQSLSRLYTALKNFDLSAAVDWSNPLAARFKEAMNDDFNTAEAVAVLFELANELNRNPDPEVARLLRGLGAILGLLQRPAERFLQDGLPEGWAVERIEQAIAARAAAKKAKNFAEADRMRNELLAAGIVLEDGAKGTTWRRK
jgi:cysteinyl-tRNA synthetase